MNKPHYVLESDGRKIAYVRVNDQNIKANDVIRKVWELKKQKEGKTVPSGCSRNPGQYDCI